MNNWNQWPPSTNVPPPPTTGYPAPGTDPMATMQAYMQYYNQPAPSGYTPEQWAAAQQQNWAVWQQWQQQYQQWHAQYGDKYQETMKQQYGATGQAPPLPITTQPPPPPPKEDKPPLPPSGNVNAYGYNTAPPPPPSGSGVGMKRSSDNDTNNDSAKKQKTETDEELSQAEKKFDDQFKQWEEKFNKWKLQNANHPDKEQYKVYEAKWTSWREKLIEKREQMRRRREEKRLEAAKAQQKDVPVDKILNIISSTENQGMINNVLGIGKTLGLSSKSETTTSTTAVGSLSSMSVQPPVVTPHVSMTPMMQPPDMTQAWAQWGQYTAPMSTTMTAPMAAPMATPMASMPPYGMNIPPPTMTAPPAIAPPNFSQPPPGFVTPNFSQPPPGFTHPPPALNTNPPPPPTSQPPPITTANMSQPPPNFIPKQQRSGNQQGQSDASNQLQGPDGGNQNNRNLRNQFINRKNRNDNFNEGGDSQYGEQDNFSKDAFGDNYDNYGNKENDRTSNRPQQNQQRQQEEMPPELRKLMEKRQMANNVFQPSSNFNKDSLSNMDSLSDSFRKAGGDKFNRNNNFDYDSRGSGNYGPSDEPNFGNRVTNKFGNREPDDFGNRGPNDFRNRGPTNFGNRGSNDFGNRGPNDFGNNESSEYDGDGSNTFDKDSNAFVNRGPNDFGTRGPNDFRNRGPNDFGNRGPNDFANRGPNDFGNRGSNDFGSRGPNDFRNRGPNDFGNREPNDFGNRGPNDFGNRGPNDFGNRGPSDFGNRGPNNFGNRGPNDFGIRGIKGLNDFRNPGPSNFGNRGPGDFGNRGPLDFDDGPFNNRGLGDFDNDDSNNFGNRGFNDFNDGPNNFDNRGPGIFGNRGRSNFGNQGPPDFNMGSQNKRGFDGPDRQDFHVNKPDDFAPNKDRSGDPSFSGKDDNISDNKKPNEEGFNVSATKESLSKLEGAPFMSTESAKSNDPSILDQSNVPKITVPSFTDDMNDDPFRDTNPFGNQFNHPPPFGKPGNFNKPGFGPSESKAIPSLLSLKIEPPRMIKVGINDHQLPFNKDGPGPFNPNRPPFGDFGPRDNDSFGPDGPINNDNFGPGPFAPNKPPFGPNGPMDRNFGPGPFGPNRPPFGPDGPMNKNFGPGPFGPNKPFGPSGPMDNRGFGPESFGPHRPPFGKDRPPFDKDAPVIVENLHQSDKDKTFDGKNRTPLTKDESLSGKDKPPFDKDSPQDEDGNFGSPDLKPNTQLPLDKDKQVDMSESAIEADNNKNMDDLEMPSEEKAVVDNEGLSTTDVETDLAPQVIETNIDFTEDSFEPIESNVGQLPIAKAAIGSSDENDNSSKDKSIDEEVVIEGSETKVLNEPEFLKGDLKSNESGDVNEINDDDKCNVGPDSGSSASHLPPSGSFREGARPFSPNHFGKSNDGHDSLDSNTPMSKSKEQSGSFTSGNSFAGSNDRSFVAGKSFTDFSEGPFGSNRSFGGSNDRASSFGPSNPFGGPNDNRSGPFNTSKSFSEPNDSPFRPNRPFSGSSDGPFAPGFAGPNNGSSGPNNPLSGPQDGSGLLGPGPGRGLFGPSGTPGPHNRSGSSGRNNDFMGETEFCVGKQFNYNHGENKPDQEFLMPSKVIDYGHEKKAPVDQIEPAIIYDYGHGKLNPDVQDPIKDFKNWEENEQNLMEYHEEMTKRSEKIGRVWTTSPSRTLEISVWNEATSKDANSDIVESFMDVDDRLKDRDERRDKDDRTLGISERIRDRGRSRGKDREDRYLDRSRSDRDRDDRHRDSDRFSDRSRDRDKDDRYRSDRDKDRSRDRERDDRHKDREDRHRDREDRHKDRHDKDRDERYKSRRDDKERDSRHKEKDSKEDKDKDMRNSLDKTIDQKDEIIDQTSNPDKDSEEDKADSSKDPEKVNDSQSEVKASNDGVPKIMELPKTPNLTMVDDLLCPPGRLTRQSKIVIILRGPPGSGKSYAAKLIKDKEVAQGGSAPRILSIDDYFLVEKDEQPGDEKKDGGDEMEYRFEEAMESEYVSHLIKAFKKNVTDGFFNFIILDSINEKISDYEEMWSFAKTKGFNVYVCEMEMDAQVCIKRNIHNRAEDEINRIVDYFEPAPSHHQKLDVSSLLQEQAIQDVEMEDIQNISNEEATVTEGESQIEIEQKSENSIEDSEEGKEDGETTKESKWERMEAEDKLDRLDGLKRKSEHKPQTMEEFLQVPDYYNEEDNSGKKHVRWADLEERKQQDKMRAVGFVVGHTNWDRMMDPSYGSSALTRTKYI